MAKDYVIENGIAKGKLKLGLKIGEVVHKEFELREYDVADLMDAEDEASASKVFSFSGQLLVRQLLRVGEFRGPFTINQIRTLKGPDWKILRSAQMELELLGEGESSDGKPT